MGGGGNKEKAEPLLRTTGFFFVPSRASFCFLGLLHFLSLASFLLLCYSSPQIAPDNHNRRSREAKRTGWLSRIWTSASPKSASFKPLVLFSIITQRRCSLNSKSSIFTHGAHQQLCRTVTHRACDISSTI